MQTSATLTHIYKHYLVRSEDVELLGIFIRRELSLTHLIEITAKDSGKRLGLLKRVLPYLNPNQRAMIYKSMVRSKREYVLSVWMSDSETSQIVALFLLHVSMPFSHMNNVEHRVT